MAIPIYILKVINLLLYKNGDDIMTSYLYFESEWLTTFTKCGEDEVVYIVPISSLDEEEVYLIGKEIKINKEINKLLKV